MVVYFVSGLPLGSASCAYPTHYPEPSWAEQRPEDWWKAVGVATRQAVEVAGVSSKDIGAVCVDTTCCTVVALAEGRSVTVLLLAEQWCLLL
jgi:ribulose kinase